MIEQVIELSKKSFKNYTGPKNKFKRINLFFGYNGRGKSSLADGIVEEFLHTEKPEHYRFYNRQFIHDNILLEDIAKNELIKGVKANFGKKDVDIEKQISELQSKIIDTSNLEEDINKKCIVIQNSFDDIFSRKKGKTNIHSRAKGSNIEETLSSYDSDYKKASEIEPRDDKLLEIKGDDFFEKEYGKIERVIISEITILSVQDIIDLERILLEKFDDVIIPDSNVVRWIKEGLEIHSNKSKCEFCGSIISINEITEKYEKYKANKRQISSEKLNEHKNKLNQIIQQLPQLKEACLLLNEESIKTIEVANETLINAVQLINNKIDDLDISIVIDSNALIDTMSKLNRTVSLLLKEKKSVLDDLKIKNDRLSILVKGSIALEIISNKAIQSEINDYRQLKSQLSTLISSNRKCLERIEELRTSKSTTKDFADYLSRELEYLELGFKLNVVGNDYVLRNTSDNQILKYSDISEGEQNLFALLYFFYELFEDSDQEVFKKEIELIVIDDPISSIDDINRMVVLEIINEILDLKTPQLFFFTHSWEDFCDICYNKSDKSDNDYRLYEIKKDQNGSKIENTKSNISPYKHHFKEIYELSKKNNPSELTDIEMYHYPNLMRKVLEEYLMFKSVNHNPTKSNIESITRVLCGEKPSNNQKMKIGVLLNVCNILSHKVARNPDEVLLSAKFLMESIKKRDLDHFCAMTG